MLQGASDYFADRSLKRAADSSKPCAERRLFVGVQMCCVRVLRDAESGVAFRELNLSIYRVFVWLCFLGATMCHGKAAAAATH